MDSTELVAMSTRRVRSQRRLEHFIVARSVVQW
jgi:hypothetical protein